MRDFFSRTAPDGDDQPVDLAQVRADDALIEALRQVPLFDDPGVAPTRWLRSVGGTVPDDVLDAVDPADDDVDADDMAAFVRSAAPGGTLRDPAEVASDAQVAALLQAWRNEIDAVPLPPPVDIAIAVAAIRSAPVRRRSVRPMIAVAAAIAGLLMGSTAIGARSAGPEDTLLWPVTQLLWGDRVAEVKASQEARDGIDDASNAIDAGYPDQAEAALEHVTSVITEVREPSVLATLKSDLGRVQSQLDSSRATSSQAPSTTPVTGASTTGPGPVAGTTTIPPTTATPSAAATVPAPPVAETTSAEPSAPESPDPVTSEAPEDPTSDAPSGDTTSVSTTPGDDTSSADPTTVSTTETTESGTSAGNGVASQGDAPASEEIPAN